MGAMLEAGSSQNDDDDRFVNKASPMSSYSTTMRIDIHKKMKEQEYLPPPGLNRELLIMLLSVKMTVKRRKIQAGEGKLRLPLHAIWIISHRPEEQTDVIVI